MMNSTTPLLSSYRVSASYTGLTNFPPLVLSNDQRHKGTKRSLRTKIQIPLLCYARLMVTMAYFSVFPYVALMAQHNSSSRTTDIGVYVGIFEVLFWAAQALASIFWGTMVDRFGGKTMLIYILLGTTISSVLFGFTSSLWEMALCRCFMGIMSGGDVVIHTMLGKRCMTETEATRGFSLSSLAGNIGMASGIVIGHTLANNVSRYSNILKTVSLLEKHPFSLTGITIGVMSATCAIVTTLFVEDANQETKGAADDMPFTWISLRELTRSRGVSDTLSSFVNISLLGYAFTAVATLSLYTEVSLDGLEFPGYEITLYMVCQGAFAGCWLFLIYPALYRLFGTQNIVSSGTFLSPFFFLSFKIMDVFLSPGSKAGFFIFRVVFGVMTIMGPAVSMLVTAVHVGLQEVSPSPRKLGLLNGVAEAASCLVRVVVLSMGILIHAFCSYHSVTVGYLNWIVLLMIGSSFSVLICSLICYAWTKLTRS